VTLKQSTLEGHAARKKDLFIVDMDVHANETPAALAPYCEMPWRKTLEHISTLPQRYLDIPAFAPMASPWPMFPDSGGDRRTTVTSAAQMRQDLDGLGVDIGLIFPDHFLLHAAMIRMPLPDALPDTAPCTTNCHLSPDSAAGGASAMSSTDYVVASAQDVADGQHILVNVRGREIGIFNIKGRYYALPNVCLHQNGPLCRGAVSGTVVANAETAWKRAWTREGEIIVCPWHSLEFDIATGACLAYPNRKLPTYPVRVEDQQLIVSL
jgi:nitrite reductase/ring-hydroxylating ferredoxin subunit